MKIQEKKATAAIPATQPKTAVEDNGMGEIQIHENVIASLALRAVLGVEGVIRMAGNSLVDSIAEVVGSRRMQERSITIEMQPDSRVAIQLKVVLSFDSKIPEVAPKIQKAVIAAVENATGMTVTKVNVLVQEFEEQSENGDDEDSGETPVSAPNVLG